MPVWFMLFASFWGVNAFVALWKQKLALCLVFFSQICLAFRDRRLARRPAVDRYGNRDGLGVMVDDYYVGCRPSGHGQGCDASERTGGAIKGASIPRITWIYHQAFHIWR
jgi:hypothetical protein